MPKMRLHKQLVADENGIVTGAESQVIPFPIEILSVAVIVTVEGCDSRTHPFRATLSGGIDYVIENEVTDCEKKTFADLDLDVNDGMTNFDFHLEGFDPNETGAEIEVVMRYDVVLFTLVAPGVMGLSPRITSMMLDDIATDDSHVISTALLAHRVGGVQNLKKIVLALEAAGEQ